MNEWDSKIKQVLSELEADKQLIPGAKLKQQLLRSTSDPASLDAFLASSGLKFAEMLERIEGIVVRKRRGSDMLVGFDGADRPVQVAMTRSSEASQQLRDDVYTAMTRVNESGYYYVPRTDQFIAGPVEDPEAIPLPPVSLDDLLEERKDFGVGRK